MDYTDLSAVTARVVAAAQAGGPLPGTVTNAGDGTASGSATNAAGTHAAGTVVVAFNTIGVGKGTAMLTFDEHRAVDVELPKAFAR